MALLDGQVQVRDLVMGPGTPFEVPEFNPFNRNVRADQSGSRAWNHGGWSGVEWTDEVVVPLLIVPIAANAAEWLQLHWKIKAAFAAIGEAVADVEMRFAIGDREYLMRGRPRMVEPEIKSIGRGFSFTKAAFVALDQRIHSGAEIVAGPISPPSFTGGLQVPITVPFTVDGVMVGGQETITNEGIEDTGLILRIDGPATEPSVTLQRADGVVQTLRFDLALGTGQWIDVDTEKRTVLFGGTASRRSQTSGEFPMLTPGSHTLLFRASSFGGAAELTSRHRHAW